MSMDKNNFSVLRQQFAQCVFNHKIHEKACDRMEKFQSKIKWLNVIVLLFVIVFLLLQTKYPDNSLFGSISIWITVFEILYLFIQKEFSIEQKAQEHKKIALQYLWLRDKYKNFIADIMNDLSNNLVISRRDLLQDQYKIITSLAPQTTYEDYKNAQLTLLWTTNSDEEFTWSDKEINRFLPKDMRI